LHNREAAELIARAARLRVARVGAEELHEYFVKWNTIQEADALALEERLASAEAERDMQAFLEANPTLLIQHLGGGHGRFVIPHQRLGAEHVTDFLIASRDSDGFHWTAVELEGPTVAPFNKKNGDQSAALTHAIGQVQNWRAWLTTNQNYAARPRAEDGLGLVEIDNVVPGLIVIGRRAMKETRPKARRRQLTKDLNIEIHSYDFLVEAARGRIAALERRPDLRR
jgi:hypothetical protein